MTQHERDRILEKASKIKKLMESEATLGNEQAAQNYAAMLQKLLHQHKLTMSDVEFEAHLVGEQVQLDWIRWQEYDRGKKRREGWVEILASIVAEAHGCRMVVTRKSNNIALIGFAANRTIASYVLVNLVRTADKVSKLERRAWRRKTKREGTYAAAGYDFRAAWLEGFVTRVKERFEEEDRKTRADEVQCTALIRVGTELARVDDWMSQQPFGRARSPKVRRGTNEAGYRAGRRAANRADLKGNALGRTEKRDDRLLN